jgi:hypothetical protein
MSRGFSFKEHFMLRELTENEVEFSVECLREDMQIEGNAMASGDDAFDKRVEEQIREDLEWNEWAWCTVRVVARWEGFEGDDYLGGCSYKSEEDFCTPDGYFPDMKTRALEALNEEVARSHAITSKLT